MPLIRQPGIIIRGDLQRAPRTLWVFGDNMLRQGMGGQAKEMRGEPNAVGVPTKWAPGTSDDDYFNPGDLYDLKVSRRFAEEFAVIAKFIEMGLDVCLPEAGVGTGLAKLEKRAPNILAFIDTFFCKMDELSERVRQR